jgi:CO/xanthine dehydrogenase Mo-binding subunit
MDFRKDLFADERPEGLREVGVTRQRADAMGHVTGRTPYYDDRQIAGLQHLKIVRSTQDHARLRAIHTAEAERMPGVRRILKAADVPANLHTVLRVINVGPLDEPVLAVDKVRYRGEPIVAIVAESPRAAYEAAAKVRIDYEPLPTVFDVEEALRPGAPHVNEHHPGNAFNYNGYDHQKVRLGDVERGFREADHVIEERYQMSPIEHAPTETNGCIAAPAENGRYVCYTSTQALFFSLDNVAPIVDISPDRLHFIGGTVGGGFGGKVDTVVEPLAVLAAMLTQKPVRYAFSRQEEMQVSSPRGAERIYIKDGVMKNGRIIARQARIYCDAGAYSRLSPYGAVKCASHMPGPYTIPNVWIDSRCVYTNRTPSSAMRGFGVTGCDFAIEVQMDKLARLVGMDPMEFRILNAYRDGDMKAHHERTEGAALIECVQVAAQMANWPIGEAYRAMSSRSHAPAPYPAASVASPARAPRSPPPAPPRAEPPAPRDAPVSRYSTVYSRTGR